MPNDEVTKLKCPKCEKYPINKTILAKDSRLVEEDFMTNGYGDVGVTLKKGHLYHFVNLFIQILGKPNRFGNCRTLWRRYTIEWTPIEEVKP